MIGDAYTYPNQNQKFVLKETNGYSFKFECGHWCTDNVFIDLIPVNKQYKLNL